MLTLNNRANFAVRRDDKKQSQCIQLTVYDSNSQMKRMPLIMVSTLILANPDMKLAIHCTVRTASPAPTIKTSASDASVKIRVVTTIVQTIHNALSIYNQTLKLVPHLFQSAVEVS